MFVCAKNHNRKHPAAMGSCREGAVFDMDVYEMLENWEALIDRSSEEDKKDGGSRNRLLLTAQTNSFNELRTSGFKIVGNDGNPLMTITDIYQMSSVKKLHSIFFIGKQSVYSFSTQTEGDGKIVERVRIQWADMFPNCAYMTLMAYIWNMDGALDLLCGNVPFHISFHPNEADSVLSDLILHLPDYYPWVEPEIVSQNSI
jgi:hypothetical protein